MKIKLENIGPIKEIDFDVDADLTFVYGKNNIGKSYAITIMYLVLKNYAFESQLINRYYYGYDYFPLPHFESIDEFKAIGKHFEANEKEMDINQLSNSHFKRFLNAIFIRNFEESLKSSFGDIANLNNKICEKSFKLTIYFSNFSFSITEKDNRLVINELNVPFDFICRKTQQQHRKPREDQNKITFYYNSDKQFDDEFQRYFASLYRDSVFEVIKSIKNVYYLPASRSGLYRALNAFSQILVELSKKRSFLHQKIILPSISEQDSDYFSKINEINIKRVSSKYSAVAQNIESKLLKGEVTYDQQTKQIMFKPNNGNIRLELLGTSSMIAEVSPIVLYLKYIIGSDEESRRRKDSESYPIIFIEEPEAHLHPEAQLILMECFVDLVNQGAKLVITSHSNYIFSKLNNLIADQKILREKVNGFQFLQTENGSICEKIQVSEIGLEDMNFLETSENLYNEKIQIIDKLV